MFVIFLSLDQNTIIAVSRLLVRENKIAKITKDTWIITNSIKLNCHQIARYKNEWPTFLQDIKIDGTFFLRFIETIGTTFLIDLVLKVKNQLHLQMKEKKRKKRKCTNLLYTNYSVVRGRAITIMVLQKRQLRSFFEHLANTRLEKADLIDYSFKGLLCYLIFHVRLFSITCLSFVIVCLHDGVAIYRACNRLLLLKLKFRTNKAISNLS